MLESYQIEVMRKRRDARIFWVVVLVCSLFLYFFFQGKYPDIRVGLRFFSESGSVAYSGSSELMRSFGIINVRVDPSDASMSIGTGATYANNEKRMSDYGEYRMEIKKEKYLSNILSFKIDEEKPFFIEKISLLPSPHYERIRGAREAYRIDDGETLIRTTSGFTLSGMTAPLPSTYSGSLVHIGGKFFQTGTGIVSWEKTGFKAALPDIANFIKTCDNITWKYSIFYCPKSSSLITVGGRYMTGIVDIENNLIEQSGSVTEIEGGKIGKSWTHTRTIDLEKIAILNGMLFIESSGSLQSEDGKSEIITAPLSGIDHVSILEEGTILLGKKQGKTHLIIRHAGDPADRERDITLPDSLDYSDARFHLLAGNIMIETSSGILLIYRGSQDIHWIVEGQILSYTVAGSIYQKDGEIWSVDWSEKL